MAAVAAAAAAAGASAGSSPILRKAFNRDGRHVAFGTAEGCFVYDIQTNKLIRGPATKAKVVAYNEDYLAVVGDGSDVLFPETKVVIWRMSQNTHIAELKFSTEILNVVLSRTRFIVVTVSQLHVYAFAGTPQRLHVIETGHNPLGLCVLAGGSDSPFVAFPGDASGSVNIDFIDPWRRGEPIAAHLHPLSCIAVSPDNQLLATTSSQGTELRIFSIETGKEVKELRRGSEVADINSIAFSPDSKYVVLASEKPSSRTTTVHVFGLTDDGHQNARSTLYTLGSYIPMASMLPVPGVVKAQWSFAQFRSTEAGCIATFGSDSSHFTVVSTSGNVFYCLIDTQVTRGCSRVERTLSILDSAREDTAAPAS